MLAKADSSHWLSQMQPASIVDLVVDETLVNPGGSRELFPTLRLVSKSLQCKIDAHFRKGSIYFSKVVGDEEAWLADLCAFYAKTTVPSVAIIVFLSYLRRGPDLNLLKKFLVSLSGNKKINNIKLNLNKNGLNGSELKSLDLAQLTQLTSLVFYNNMMGDAEIKHLAQLTQLTSLEASCVGLEAGGIESIATLTKLTSLNISSGSYHLDNVDWLAQLSTLKQLTYLNISRNSVTATKLNQLTALDKLTSLNASECGLASQVKQLTPLTQLTSLNLYKNDLTDVEIKYLTRLKRLTALDISSNNLTDAGIVSLTSLMQLNVIDISWNKITETGLVPLLALTKLVSLYNGKLLTSMEKQQIIDKFTSVEPK